VSDFVTALAYESGYKIGIEKAISIIESLPMPKTYRDGGDATCEEVAMYAKVIGESLKALEELAASIRQSDVE